MNEIKIMKRAFGFLLENGYVSTVSRSNIEYSVMYCTEEQRIILSYDLRSHEFDVGIQKVKSPEDIPPYFSLLETRIGTKLQRERVTETIKKITLEAQQDRTISKRHFCALVSVYSDYVRNNLEEIINYC